MHISSASSGALEKNGSWCHVRCSREEHVLAPHQVLQRRMGPNAMLGALEEIVSLPSGDLGLLDLQKKEKGNLVWGF